MNLANKFVNFYLITSILFLAFFVPLVLFAEWVHSPTHHTQEVVYYVEEGSSIADVANALSAQNVLTHPTWFKIYAKIMGVERKIKSGTFVFTANNSPADVLNKLVDGDSIKLKVVIPEGLNIYQIAEKLAETFPKYSSDDWLKLMSDTNIIAQLPVKDSSIKTVEGFLFPNTYFFDPNESPTHVLQTFILHFKQVITPDMIAKAHALGLNLFEFVTLASIIQKESGIPTELNKISGVFFNRLHLRMRLQSDPTVIYGAWNDYKGKITKKHLRTPTQYNTYTKYGLPAGPIANPGLASLQAVLNPAQSKNLYFVSSGDGTHTFSDSYNTHKKAVKIYIKQSRSHAH